jgi:hypothetical protein|tara:strand:+ start:193 stop:459 length:267 start_codon:yes stop_codon:yes gene_type:complete
MSDTEIEQPVKETADSILEKSKESFADVVVIGVKEDGTIIINASGHNTQFCHWMLNKALFELNLYEQHQQGLQQQATENSDETETEAS